MGSHCAEALLCRGHKVKIYDSLSPQVHASGCPSYIAKELEFIHGDVRDGERLSRAVRGAEVIFHLAAAVGVGQSMYQISDYVAANTLGTANLLQAILDTRSQPEKIIVASSMSIYGEGKYLCADCGEVGPPPRNVAQLQDKRWEVLCPHCHREVQPVATDERKPLQSTSIYALSKKDQEEMVLLFGRTYRIPAVALRYFNIYGTRQSLSNPYTGVIAIFASRLMNGNPPVIFEDGRQIRDFVSVHDIVRANLLAMEMPNADGMALNIGSGEAITIADIATELASALKCELAAEITDKYRAGDIRHCFANITAASLALNYKPQVRLKDGLRELVEWLAGQQADDHVEEAMQRLSVHGLVA